MHLFCTMLQASSAAPKGFQGLGAGERGPVTGYLPTGRGCSSPAAGPGRAGAAAACCGRRRAGPAGRVPRRPGLSPTAACWPRRTAAAAPAATALRAGDRHRLSVRRRRPPDGPPRVPAAPCAPPPGPAPFRGSVPAAGRHRLTSRRRPARRRGAA